MLTRGLFLVTILTFLQSSLQLGIDLIPVSETDGLVFVNHKMIFIQTSTRYVTYKFNLSNLNFIDNNRKKIDTLCPNSKTRLQIFDQAILKISPIFGHTNNYTIVKENVTDIKTTAFINLNSQIQQFLTGDCILLENILDSILSLKKTFSSLANNHAESLFDVLDRSRFQSDVLIATKLSGYSTPFNHQLFFTEVWKYVKLHYNFKNDLAHVEFEIPLFSGDRMNLLAVFTKPMIHEGFAYIFYTSDARYAVITSHNATVFTERDYKESCHNSVGIYYCMRPVQTLNSCFNRFVHSNNLTFSNNCFIELENHNMITQIGRDIHFTIFSPLRVNIIQGNFVLTTVIPFSSYLSNQITYNISTPFFFYSPQLPEKYEIFYETDDASMNLTRSFRFGKVDLIFLIICSTIIIFFTIIPYLTSRPLEQARSPTIA